jgi:hypothetical protein
MGSDGIKPRKPRRRMARVSKYPVSSGNPLAGLTGGGDGLSGPGASHGPSEHHHPIGKIGSAFLWLLGRRPTPMPPASEPEPAHDEHPDDGE